MRSRSINCRKTFASLCALLATEFDVLAAVESVDVLLVVRHPDGGFRRFAVSADGRDLAVVDGADQAPAPVAPPELLPQLVVVVLGAAGGQPERPAGAVLPAAPAQPPAPPEPEAVDAEDVWAAALAEGQPVAHPQLNGPVVDPASTPNVVSSQSEVDDLLASLGF